MSLILSGTDGLSDIDGSAATPAIRGTDANTGIFFPAADTIAFAEGGAEIARFDSSGNLGIGTSSPSYRLQVSAAGNTLGGYFYTPSGLSGIRIETAANDKAIAEFYTNGNRNWSIGPGQTTAGAFEFRDVTASSTRMLIDSNGQVGIAQTPVAVGGPLQVTYNSSVNACVRLSTNNASTAGELINFIKSTGAATGAISFGASQNTIVYGGTSDYRLKENVAPMTGALATVSALRPCTYTWKEDGSEGQGFIAHELQEVFPDAVVGEKDAVETYTDEDNKEQTRPKYQAIDTSFLVATLTAAIQEQQALIQQQSASITALTARITALEANNA
jgi:hypothetical protein